ncbi:hypothetical protein [Alkalihalobacillus sp. BA299]|uniref:hypothetical protein n=1 Tax=Alkalihalobacillus sp. BA299 TaxID=2815938 RepID=UPI001ADCDE4E|nr:hypothetical protein [Alkalihalobacillus sp. BA299]
MPSISKIRLTNIVYEEGNKRYNDETFLFDGHNGAILLENGGGKTVLIQTALQAIMPHADLAARKIKNTLQLENAPAHIAIEWITSDKTRRYVTTAVSLFMTKNGLDSLRYVYEYDANDPYRIEEIPFVRDGKEGKRPAEKGEMQDYYSTMREKSFRARTFPTIKEYKAFLEEQYHIIESEWENVIKINSTEGGVEAFFDDCKSTNQLFDRLLIPTVERSISGHDENLFADMFEKQHASFKNYKKLKETIEENERIQAKLEGYVQIYEKLHQAVLDYGKAKERAKGTWNVTLAEKQRSSEEKQELLQKLDQLKEEERLHQIKTASYEIHTEESIYKQLAEEYKQSLTLKEQLQEDIDYFEKEYFSLKFAELKEQRQEHLYLLQQIEGELAKLERNVDIEESKEELAVSKQTLLGYFQAEIEKIEATKREVNYELEPIKRQIEELLEQTEELTKKERVIVKQLSEIIGKMNSREDDLATLKQQLLANPDQEKVAEEMEKWIARVQFLDEEIIRLHQEANQLKLEGKAASDQIDAYRSEKEEFERTKRTLMDQQADAERNQQQVIDQLTMLRPQWATIDNLYLKQETVVKRIEEQIKQLEAEKEELLIRERIAFRYVDDYENQENFFGDPYIEQQLLSWKNQLDYVITGVEYLQDLEEAEREALETFPLWPIALVTTRKSKQELERKVEHISDRLQLPIVVMTMEEALAIHDQSDHYSWIAPKHWSANTETEPFTEWKIQIAEIAKAQAQQRKDKESEVTLWKNVQGAVMQFFTSYPYELVKQRKEDIAKLTIQIDERIHLMKKQKQRQVEIEIKQNENQKKAIDDREEKQSLEARIDKGNLYQQLDADLKGLKKQKIIIEKQLEELEKSLKANKVQLDDRNQHQEEINERIQQLELELMVIKKDDDYFAVRQLTPIFTNDSKGVIKDKIQRLELEIRKMSESLVELETKRDSQRQLLEDKEKRMEELRKEFDQLNENKDFPADGHALLATHRNKLQSSRKRLQQQSDDVQKKSAKKDEQKGKWISKVEQFEKDYSGHSIVIFEEAATEIVERLKDEKQKLKSKKDYLLQERTRIELQFEAIIEAERLLERFIEGHKFQAPHIAAYKLTSDEQRDFHYNRKQFVMDVTERLKINKENGDQEKNDVDVAKRTFREFCQEHISDVKMRNMALNGIEHKVTYEDILEFRKNMLVSVERATNYANEHIRQKDAELQAFISNIHSHLVNVVEEMRQIPKKTKVKVLDDWKQIFTFSIPEWKEEEGKARIRDHIEWILEQLENERFLNEQGIQDDGKVRKEIEMWLQSKQLLQIVMNNEGMKVTCRKVTNDKKVTTRSYSWEQSNVWSGGEKWSKNMTLFLGILNYVAEKKQHIQPKMKRHRVVILDNSFGKASSDHVLSPVFFVADQLGFQIIALTAHAEGKFLQDYFPIIYSCRLRPTSNGTKKVMTKSKMLHHAYFQDHEPTVVERLGETEHMSLFD